MVNVAVLVAVLTVAVLAPSTTFAATQTVRTAQVSSHTGIALLDMILSAFGFNSVSGSRTTPTQVPSATLNRTQQPTQEGAIWGGGNRCPYGC
jgi:hypothetical protein